MESEDLLGYMLLHTASVLERQVDQVLQEQIGIGYSQYRILLFLTIYPKLKQRELAGHLGQTEASISRQAKMLLARQFIAPVSQTDSNRDHVLSITSKGTHVTEAGKKLLMTYLNPGLAKLDEKQRKQLLERMMILHEWVCQPGRLTSCDHPFAL